MWAATVSTNREDKRDRLVGGTLSRETLREESGGRDGRAERRGGVEKKVERNFFFSLRILEKADPSSPARWCVSSVRFASVHPQMQIRILSQYKEPLKGLVRLKIERSNLCRLTSWSVSVFSGRIPAVCTFQETCQCCGSSRRSIAKTHEKKSKRNILKKKKTLTQQRSLAWDCDFNAMFSGAK